MEQLHYQKKKQQNKQLLLLYRRLLELEESCWSKLFRFQTTQLFIHFEKKYSVNKIVNIRLDDCIYLILLIILQLIFGLLPISSNTIITTPYRQSLALYFLTSFIAIISPHWFRWLALSLFCIGYPSLIFLTFSGIVNIMPIDTSTSMFDYLGYLTLVPIFVLLVLVYPLKEYIRKNAGSLYSYIYGLGLTLILYLWPLYSFIGELSSTGSISFDFIVKNEPLIIAFIILLVTAFYFFTHHSLFQAKLQNVQTLLLADYSKGQLTKVLEETEEEHLNNTSCFYSHFNIYVRSMSFIIYALTIATQLFLYFTWVNNTSKMVIIGCIMGYVILFLLFGALIIYIPASKQAMIPIMAIISLAPAASTILYYSSSFDFFTYAYIGLALPFLSIFWSIIKSVSPKKPIFRINSIVILYLTIYIPVITFVLHTQQFFTADPLTIKILKYTIASLILGSLLTLLIVFIVWQVIKRRGQSSSQQQKQRVPLDYNYNQQGNPEYQYYQISNQFSVSYLSSVDLRQIGYIFGMSFFLFSQLLSIHAINQLNTTFQNTTFYSSTINQVIYSQFTIITIFYIYTHIYLTNPQIQSIKIIFIVLFSTLAIICLTMGYMVNYRSTTLKIVGGFNLLMILIVVAMQAIKSVAHQIFGFVSSMIVIALWIFIIMPYVQIIPFVSIYIDQTKFGTYIYGCVIGSVVLLVFLVGILTLVFNRLIDKYEQQKRYKFMMEDVITLLEDEGVEAADEEVHVLYESFHYRDKKYVFFLKRGFPVNLLQDPDDKITKLVTSEDYGLKKIPTKKQMTSEQEKQQSCLWKTLTFCCGEDEEELTQKLKKAKKIMDKDQLQSLLPKNLMSGLAKSQKQIPVQKIKKKWVNPSKMFSSKSLILKDLHSGPRFLGDEYILLKTGKKAQLAIQIWHNVFDFIANCDEGEPMIISNDFTVFIEIAGINMTAADIDKIFYDFATKKWKQNSGMDLQNFSLAIEQISQKIYQNHQEQQRKFYLLIDKVYYNLCAYEQFNNLQVEKKTTKRVTKTQLKNSPFQTSLVKYREYKKLMKVEEDNLIKRVKKYDTNKFLEPKVMRDVVYEKEEEEQQHAVGGKSCKKGLYEKIVACENCCKKEENKQQIQRKLFVRPWKMLSVQAVKIMQRKQIQWGSVVQMKDRPFRFKSDNILMAAFKILDIYTFINITISNPQTGWISGQSVSSSLYLGYTTQTYLAAAIVAISVPLGIKGIMLIFQDRLGLTQSRLPAAFPHPMFFFTFIYKLIILSLFGIVTQTFLDTFNCNWTADSPPYTLYDQTSIQCFSSSHSKFVIISLVSLIAYYPLSSYAMPNFQFAEKSLDLKYRSSYLILYFQVNFILLATQVLLSRLLTTAFVQIIYSWINITSLVLLAASVFIINPCFIQWFNYVQFQVILIGIIFNVMGFVLYMTGYWLTCVIVASSLSVLSFIIMICFIRTRFFVKQIAQVHEQQAGNVQQLQLMWRNKQQNMKKVIQFQSNNSKPFVIQKQNIAVDLLSSQKNTIQQKQNS